MKDNKERKFPLPGDGAYTSREESGDFRKIDQDDDDQRQESERGVPPAIDEQVTGGEHAGTPGLVHHRAQLAQAPAQLAARIVGHVPEQLAQRAATHGPG